MVRHLTTLILGGILGSMVLVGNAEACSQEELPARGSGGCAAPGRVCDSSRLPAPRPAPCVKTSRSCKPVAQTCAPKVKCCKLTLPKLCLPKFCQKKTCRPGRRGLRNARPVVLPRLLSVPRHRLRLSTDRPPTIYPPISHDRLHHAVEIVTIPPRRSNPSGCAANCRRARLGYSPRYLLAAQFSRSRSRTGRSRSRERRVW